MKAQERARLAEIYCGILHGSRAFQRGEAVSFAYDFTSPAYETLKETYSLEKIAGKGGDFERARRLCLYFAPKLVHKGDYIGEMHDSLKILEQSFDKPENGINCVAKAKILADACLALGVFARRIWLIPNSPYDCDCHVVTEIFDRKRGKWLLLDPTTGGYFSDGNGPLGAPEVREKFALRQPVSVVLACQSVKDIAALGERNGDLNLYYLKNLFLLAPETVSAYGVEGDCAYLLPEGFDRRAQKEQNLRYVQSVCGGEIKEAAETMLDGLGSYRPICGSLAMWNAPTL